MLKNGKKKTSKEWKFNERLAEHGSVARGRKRERDGEEEKGKKIYPRDGEWGRNSLGFIYEPSHCGCCHPDLERPWEAESQLTER